jgi:hypothetical protein
MVDLTQKVKSLFGCSPALKTGIAMASIARYSIPMALRILPDRVKPTSNEEFQSG